MTWPVVSLDDLKADQPRAITDGPFGSNLARRHYTESGPRVVRLQNIGDGRFVDEKAHISEDHFRSLQAHEVRAGDLLVASLGEVLPRGCLAPPSLGPAIVKADCIRVRLGERADPRWVLYALQRPEVRRWADEHRHGVGRPRLGLKTIREIPIPLPPLDEQRRIVDLLEDHLSRLDAAEPDLAAAQRKVDKLWLSHLAQIRTSLVAAPMRAIGDVADTTLGKMLDAKRQTGVATPYLRNINVRWRHIDLSDIRSTPLTGPETERFAVRPGDLMVCEGGEPGRCAAWTGEAGRVAFQKALHRIRVESTDDVVPEFLGLMLEEGIRSGRHDRLFTGTTIKHLPQERLRGIELPVPGPDVQRSVVEGVSNLLASMRRLDDSVCAARRHGMMLRSALVGAAFSGRLTRTASGLSEVGEMIGA